MRLLNNDVEKRLVNHDCYDGDGRIGGPGGEAGSGTGFQFPPIGDEFLSHAQNNAKVSVAFGAHF